MKKIIFLVTLLATFITNAQVPQGISYQAIALNASGNPVISSNIGIKLSILDNSATGTIIYSETHLKTTNSQGLFNLVIGQGTTISGVFNTINWGTNSKFLKVEMDAAGGTNYALVGTTQLLSVPYALAADTLITSPGEGITLVSPNGTPYQLNVNDAGQLSLPTSNSSNNYPSTLYAYGTFNSYNPTTSLLLASEWNYFWGYKYFTSGTEVKFLSMNNASSPIYGLGPSSTLVVNGSAYTIPSNGFYHLFAYIYNEQPIMELSVNQFSPVLTLNNWENFNPTTYDVVTNKFTFIVNGITNSTGTFKFGLPTHSGSNTDANYGDFLGDGTLDLDGPYITFPNTTTTPKNYKIELIINFNGSGTYTITQL